MSNAWSWIVSDRSLPSRMAIGLAILAALAINDYRLNGPRATRWREYAFLLACVLLAIAYGILNDLITSRLSIEYFLYGKGVAEQVSSEVLANPRQHRLALDLQAMRIGALATWSAGLVGGALLLFANSVGQRRPLPLRELARLVPLMPAWAVLFAIIGGVIGGRGGFTWWSQDFREMVETDQWRPYRFMAVFGIHLGGYVGSLVGLVVAIVIVLKRRSRSPAT